MLTSTQKKKLSGNHQWDSRKQRADFNFDMSRKLKQRLDEFNDLILIMENMPKQVLENIKLIENVPAIIRLLENILSFFDPWAIGDYEDGRKRVFRVYGSETPKCPPGKCAIYSASHTASEQEIGINNCLQECLTKLRLYVDPCIPDPAPHDPKYTRLLEDKFRQTRQWSYSTSFDSYFDEIGINERGLIVREATMVDIDQLSNMRFKPRGLKSCIDLPPFHEPKKIPRGEEEIRLTAYIKNGEDTRYSLSESGGEEREITEKEYLRRYLELESLKKQIE